jgi:glucan 1,3-beta-glucosidase
MVFEYILAALGVLAQVVMPITAAPTAASSQCTSALGPGTAGPNDPFWLEAIAHQVCHFFFASAYSSDVVFYLYCSDLWQGMAPFNSDASTYKVFRNVKDFGAKGDGVTDDTAAIK